MLRYADLVAPSSYVRDPSPGEAALVVPSDDVPDLLALLDGCEGYVLVERAQPGPREAVMQYVQCGSALTINCLRRLSYAVPVSITTQ
jgi:hypothetical protein